MKLETSAKQKVSMKIATEGYSRPMSKTSSFLRFLVKICFITIKKSNDRIKFSFTKAFLYLIGSYGWLVAGVTISDALGLDDKFNFEVILIIIIVKPKSKVQSPKSKDQKDLG